MTVEQKALMELFMKTVPKTAVAMERSAVLKRLFAEGLVEFFVGTDQAVRVRLIEYQDGQRRIS
jgi:hypothetical protein